jgi:hypothetical protein
MGLYSRIHFYNIFENCDIMHWRKIMIKLIKISLACTSMLMMGFLSSANASMPLPVGWYLEGNVGQANVSNITYASNSTNNTTGIAMNANVGYKFMPFFAFEGGYSTYGNTNAESYNTKVAKATTQTYDIAGKVMLPIQNSGFEFLAKLGLGRTRTHVTNANPGYATANGITVDAGTDISTSVIYGIGGEYAFSPNFLVNAQWMRADGGTRTGNLDAYLIGVDYLFG